MPRLNEVVSPDRKWKAWVTLYRGLNSNAYQFNVQRAGFLGFLKRKSESLGTDYYDPSSQFQFPDQPIGRGLKVDSITFSTKTADLKYTETLQFAHMPPRETQQTCSIELR